MVQSSGFQAAIEEQLFGAEQPVAECVCLFGETAIAAESVDLRQRIDRLHHPKLEVAQEFSIGLCCRIGLREAATFVAVPMPVSGRCRLAPEWHRLRGGQRCSGQGFLIALLGLANPQVEILLGSSH